MGARRKLNGAYFNGALVIAALLGWLFGSWNIFLGSLAVLVILNMGSGNIRPPRRR